jgi:hypothetical protein
MDALKNEVAAVAARMVVEEGLEYGAAKRHAVKQLGLPPRSALPDNDVLEAAVEEYIAVFCSDTQPVELRALRQLALVWMDRLERFRPHIAGAVWHGTATRLSDIYLQLFCDDPKSAEISLIDMDVRYEPRTVTGFQGDPVDALSVQAWCADLQEYVGVHLLVYDFDDMRGAMRADGNQRGQSPPDIGGDGCHRRPVGCGCGVVALASPRGPGGAGAGRRVLVAPVGNPTGRHGGDAVIQRASVTVELLGNMVRAMH